MLTLSKQFTSLLITSKSPWILSPTATYFTTPSVNDSQLALPKKPTGAFFLFQEKELPVVKAGNPNLKVTQLATIVGQKWSQLGEAEKQAYQDQYFKSLDEYKKAIASIEADPKLNEQLTKLKQEGSKKRADAALRRAKKAKAALMKDLGRPKLPASSFLLFFNEKWPIYYQKSSKVTETTQAISSLWGQLSQYEKEGYAEKSKKLREEYKADLEAWKLKMHQADHNENITAVEKKLTNATKRKKRLNKE